MALKTTNCSVWLHFIKYIFFKSPNIFLWVNEGDASAQVSVWLLNDRSLIPNWSLNPNVSLISLLLDCRAVVLCAGIFLHTADAASASGLLHLLEARPYTLPLTHESITHEFITQLVHVCVCLCTQTHSMHRAREGEMGLRYFMHCFYCLPLLKLKVWSWDIHGGAAASGSLLHILHHQVIVGAITFPKTHLLILHLREKFTFPAVLRGWKHRVLKIIWVNLIIQCRNIHRYYLKN